MATLYHFPCFHSLSFPRPSLFFRSPSLYSALNRRHNFRYSTISASSVKRAGKKPKSDEELCNDIKALLSSVGLPENHVPTMKELALHGRQDLANIVRRRGYKFIKQLLETSSTQNLSGSDIDTGQTGNLESSHFVFVIRKVQNEKQNVLFVEVLSDESNDEDANSCLEEVEELQLNDQSSIAVESLSLQEKVARFIQLGELDETEDGALGFTNDIKADEEGQNTEFAFSMENGNVPSSALKVKDPALETERNNFISTKEQTNATGDALDDEKQKGVNHADIQQLRLLLHQKELELTHLKEQIEKEKIALSLLHSRAEEEISKAKELISEKEAELQAAEETLSELIEVEIQYSGNGETVELAGSFNGWHHKILMDLMSTSSTTDPTDSGTPQVWQVLLWLYPGVYEIKFVVDGQWIVDSKRESITRNGVHNNILRVDK